MTRRVRRTPFPTGAGCGTMDIGDRASFDCRAEIHSQKTPRTADAIRGPYSDTSCDPCDGSMV